MENDITKMTDHDLLITMHEQIKNIRTDIKDLKDGTADELSDHEKRIKALEDRKIARDQQIKEEANTYSYYFKVAIGLGVTILAMIIWHLTGFKL